MLLAASLLVTDGKLPVKVALSKAGFSALEIAKEKKQRQVRRRRDFLLKKKVTTKVKGRRAMTTLPRSLPRKLNNANQGVSNIINQNEIDSNITETYSSYPKTVNDSSRLDALIFACSMQKPIAASLPPILSSASMVESNPNIAISSPLRGSSGTVYGTDVHASTSI